MRFFLSIQVHVIKTASFILYIHCDAAQVQSSTCVLVGEQTGEWRRRPPASGGVSGIEILQLFFFFLKFLLKNFNSSTSGVICM